MKSTPADLRDLVVALGDRLQRLVVGRDPEADQAVGDRIAVEDVDPGLLAIGLLQRFGGVEARRPRPDHREMPHSPLLSLRECLAARVAAVSPWNDPRAGRRPSSAARPGSMPENMPSIGGQQHLQAHLGLLDVDGRRDLLAHRLTSRLSWSPAQPVCTCGAARNMLLRACGRCWRCGAALRPCRACAAGRLRWAESFLRCRPPFSAFQAAASEYDSTDAVGSGGRWLSIAAPAAAQTPRLLRPGTRPPTISPPARTSRATGAGIWRPPGARASQGVQRISGHLPGRPESSRPGSCSGRRRRGRGAAASRSSFRRRPNGRTSSRRCAT